MIKARRLSEVRDLLASPDFIAWWDSLVRARTALAEGTERHDELITQAMLMDFRAELAQKNAIDTLYRSGEYEDSSSTLLAESQELENQSFKDLSDFEELRFKVSEIWYKLGAAERRLDEQREEIKQLQAQRDAAPANGRRELEARISALEHELKLGERNHRQIHGEYERESSKKNRIWEEVERIWAKSAEMNLTIAEKKMQAKKVRREAERLFAQAEERKQRGQKIREEAEGADRSREASSLAVAEGLRSAREKFGCAIGDEFLYLREKDQNNRAFAVALVNDSQTFNIEVKQLGIYSVDRTRGVGFLEPAVEQATNPEEGDRRFEEYFLKGRRGEPRKQLTS